MRDTGTKLTQEDTEHFPEIRQLSYAGVRYQLNHQLALGATSTVFKAADEWGNPLVVKRYQADADAAMWKKEVANLHRLRHPRIIFMHAAFEQQGWRYIVLERWGVAFGRFKLKKPQGRERLCRLAARSTLEALHYIHRAGYVHGDMNPGNVLIKLTEANKPVGIKLCDLALAQAMVPGSRIKLKVAAWNPAPEWYDTATFGAVGQPMDIYHTALLLLEVLLGELPVFSEEEIVRGAPQRLALDLHSQLGEALALALTPQASERPVAVALWRAIAKATSPQLPAAKQ